MTSLRFQRVVFGAVGAALFLGAGCKDPPPGPTKLFEEDGSYSLKNFDFDGSGLSEIEPNNREDAFLMRLYAEEQVAQVAMCAESEEEDPTNSPCRTLATGTSWFCECFSYAYEEDQMLWRRFSAGMTPPMVEFAEDSASAGASASASATDTDTDGGGGGGGTAGIDPAADTLITLAESAGIKGQYVFAPLPIGVFGSDGVSSQYVFQQLAPSLFDQVFEDPDGRPGCQRCIPE